MGVNSKTVSLLSLPVKAWARVAGPKKDGALTRATHGGNNIGALGCALSGSASARWLMNWARVGGSAMVWNARRDVRSYDED